MENSCKPLVANWLKTLPAQEDLCGNTIYFIKSSTGIKMYVTNYQGVASLIGEATSTGDIIITSPNETITVQQFGQTFQIEVSSTLQALINGALQEGDNISLLNNDAEYITLADVPIVVIPDHNDLDGLQGGHVGEYYHLTEEEYNNNIDNLIILNTIEDLESYSGESTTLIVKDSIRGGLFNFITTGTIDNGTVFNATGKGAGYWKRQYTQADGINLQWFGVNENNTDNSVLIEDVISNIGGKIFLPKGTYKIQNTIGDVGDSGTKFITKDTYLYGEEGTIILVENPVTTEISSVIGFNMLGAKFEIHNIVLEANNIANRGVYVRQVDVNPDAPYSNIKIRNIEVNDIYIGADFKENSGAGIYVYGKFETIDIDENYIENVVSGNSTRAVAGIFTSGTASVNRLPKYVDIYKNIIKNISRDGFVNQTDQDGISCLYDLNALGGSADNKLTIHKNTVINSRGRFVKVQQQKGIVKQNLFIIEEDFEMPLTNTTFGVDFQLSEGIASENEFIYNQLVGASHLAPYNFTERTNDTEIHRIIIESTKVFSIAPLPQFCRLTEPGEMNGQFIVKNNTVIAPVSNFMNFSSTSSKTTNRRFIFEDNTVSSLTTNWINNESGKALEVVAINNVNKGASIPLSNNYEKSILINNIGINEPDTYLKDIDLYHINPNDFSGTDTQRIQQAVDLASLSKRPVRINKNNVSGVNQWNIEEAILLNSNTTIYIENAKLKLTDTSRDNMFRSANSGFGITTTLENRLSNINIIGLGEVILEGADNPRSTGDALKTLSLTSSLASGSLSYGTDAGVVGQEQTGDWRNIMILMACVDGFKLDNVLIQNSHCYGVSMERVIGFNITNIRLNNVLQRTIEGNVRTVKNTDGINLRVSGGFGVIDNISGVSGDDAVAFNSQPVSNWGVGTFNPSMQVTGQSTADPSLYKINNVRVSTVKTDCFANQVRVLNHAGAVLSDMTFENIIDNGNPLDTFRPHSGSCIVFGSNNPTYGGPTPLGDCKNITVSNVVSNVNQYAIRIDGSVSESSFNNIIKNNSPEFTAQPPVSFLASATSRNLAVSNLVDTELNKTTWSGEYNVRTLRDITTELNSFGIGVTSTAGTVLAGDNLDLITHPTGIYAFTSTAIGNPTSSSGTVMINKSGAGNYVTQFIQCINANDIVRSFVRHYRPVAGVWSTREIVYTTDLALKANDNAVVKLTGNQTVAGVKTFSSSPIAPDATAPNELATLGQVEGLVDDYVLKSGDTMTGDLQVNKSGSWSIYQDNANSFSTIGMFATGAPYLTFQDKATTYNNSLTVNSTATVLNSSNPTYKGIVGGSVFDKADDPLAYTQIDDVVLRKGTLSGSPITGNIVTDEISIGHENTVDGTTSKIFFFDALTLIKATNDTYTSQIGVSTSDIQVFSDNPSSKGISSTVFFDKQNDPNAYAQLGDVTGYVSKTADYTILDTDHCIDLTANSATFTLPTAIGRTGKQFVIKNSGSGTTLTLEADGTETIDGALTKIYNSQYSGARVISDGANWKIIGLF